MRVEVEERMEFPGKAWHEFPLGRSEKLQRKFEELQWVEHHLAFSFCSDALTLPETNIAPENGWL